MVSPVTSQYVPRGPSTTTAFDPSGATSEPSKVARSDLTLWIMAFESSTHRALEDESKLAHTGSIPSRSILFSTLLPSTENFVRTLPLRHIRPASGLSPLSENLTRIFVNGWAIPAFGNGTRSASLPV